MKLPIAAIFFLAAPSAWGAEATGVVRGINPALNLIELDTGLAFILDDPEGLELVHEGQRVTVTYDTNAEGQRIAHTVTVTDDTMAIPGRTP